MIELLNGFPPNVLAFAAKGRLTGEDYAKTLIPAVEKLLATEGRIRLYYQIGPDFEEIDPAAFWQDFKVGFEHITRWEKIAVVTDVPWISWSVHAFQFLVPGETRVFGVSQAQEARAWIAN